MNLDELPQINIGKIIYRPEKSALAAITMWENIAYINIKTEAYGRVANLPPIPLTTPDDNPQTFFHQPRVFHLEIPKNTPFIFGRENALKMLEREIDLLVFLNEVLNRSKNS